MKRRSKIILGLVVLIMLTAGFLGFGLALKFKTTLPKEPGVTTQQPATDTPLIEAINQYRESKKLPDLKRDARLDESAQVRADEIARVGQAAWTHTRPDGTSFITAVYNTTDYKVAGENLVECAETNKQAVDSWIKSKPHQLNMLGRLVKGGDWQAIGSARAYDERNKCLVFVTHFGRSE